MTLSDAVRLRLAFANYFHARGMPSAYLEADALREMMLEQLAKMDPQDRCRRRTLITFRKNERLCQEIVGHSSDDPRVRQYLDELDALLASEREARRLKRETA